MPVFVAERSEKTRVIPGYRGRYMVGDLGRVYSGGLELSLVGGRYVNLCRDGRVDRTDVAYLVARAFIPNIEGRPYVIHRDGDLRNNRVENLEWSEVKRTRLGGRSGRPCFSRGVVQYDLGGNYVATYGSLLEASEKTGVSRCQIRSCAEGRSGRAKGWIFRYC